MMNAVMGQTLELEMVGESFHDQIEAVVRDVAPILEVAGGSISIVEQDDVVGGGSTSVGRFGDLAARSAESVSEEVGELARTLLEWASDVYDFMADGAPGDRLRTVVLPTHGSAGERAYVVIAASRPIVLMLLTRLLSRHCAE